MIYTKDDLFSIAKRYHNTKRGYLIVNKKQSKYLPTKPGDTLEMVTALKQKIYCEDKNTIDFEASTLVIGFAETATALGHLFANHFSQAFYLTTTRENLGSEKCIDFREEHSHVVEQRLYYGELERFIEETGNLKQVIFVDDEFTTGNTLRNLAVELFKKFPALAKCDKFAVTIVDRINHKNKKKLKGLGIKVYSLLSFADDNFEKIVKQIRVFEPLDICLRCNNKYANLIKIHKNNEWGRNARLGFLCSLCIEETDLAKSLYEQYKEQIEKANNILVLGTEEFMSVPIYFAREMEVRMKNVVCHATARTPIGVNNSLKNYPIKQGYKIPSFYDSERLSYLYSMGHYDLVFILTDSKEIPEGTIKAVSYLMNTYKNNEINLIQFQ